MTKFPKTLYVSEQGEDEDKFLNAAGEMEACVEDDGPTEIAVYMLQRKVRVSKVLKVDGE